MNEYEKRTLNPNIHSFALIILKTSVLIVLDPAPAIF